MIRLIEALNFRCLRYVHQPLDPFHVLVGPNATGKSTFLDVVAFLGRLVAEGPEAAISERTQNFEDLVWGRTGDRFDLAIEVAIPEDRRPQTPKTYDTIRYQVAVGRDAESREVGILEESVILKNWRLPPRIYRELFPMSVTPPVKFVVPKSTSTRRVLTKAHKGNDNFYSELREKTGKGWFPSIRLGAQRSALGNVPADDRRFPASIWLKGLLADSIQTLVLNSLLIRNPSPPGQARRFKMDGSNLPWVIADLAVRDRDRFQAWLAHLQTALPDLKNLEIIERLEDRHRYLIVEYCSGLRVPSWMASDGTLRLLALTLPAYLPEFQGIYLIEEPENGIHPRAIETLFQSLSSVYGAQILVATHSPVILGAAQLKHVLCFKKTDEGATDIVRGDEHPALREWKGEANLGSLFAAGVLG